MQVRDRGSGTGAENVLQGPSPRRTRRKVPNVVLRELVLHLRKRVLLEFLDCVNLFRLRAVSRDERDVNLAAECVWFVFDSYAVAREVPTAVLKQVETSTTLRGLWVTLPFPLGTVSNMQSNDVRTLSFRYMILETPSKIKAVAEVIKGQVSALRFF